MLFRNKIIINSSFIRVFFSSIPRFILFKFKFLFFFYPLYFSGLIFLELKKLFFTKSVRFFFFKTNFFNRLFLSDLNQYFSFSNLLCLCTNFLDELLNSVSDLLERKFNFYPFAFFYKGKLFNVTSIFMFLFSIVSFFFKNFCFYFLAWADPFLFFSKCVYIFKKCAVVCDLVT